MLNVLFFSDRIEYNWSDLRRAAGAVLELSGYGLDDGHAQQFVAHIRATQVCCDEESTRSFLVGIRARNMLHTCAWDDVRVLDVDGSLNPVSVYVALRLFCGVCTVCDAQPVRAVRQDASVHAV